MSRREPVLLAAAGALLLAGCTSGGPTDEGTAPAPGASVSGRSSASPAPAPSPSASPANEPYTLAESAAPKTRSEAAAFVRGLTVRPDYFGSGYRKRDPYETGPATWTVLGDDCIWRREPLAPTVLASLTRSFIRPAAGGKGPVHVSLTVTVHSSEVGARRDMAVSLEEPLRCPTQQLTATERVQGMASRGDPFTEQRTATSDDNLTEFGEYVVDGGGKARRFDWFKHRLGPVTVAATVRHAPGGTEAETTAVTEAALSGVGYVTADIDRLGKKDKGAQAPDAEAKDAGDE
ncbi:hypothetical protein ACFWVC_16980 [Streptomyces sp. NPDC058691]|uniref:hypothetical protein n=1 Tax=Streptomyces sp. NPDC058691 TaxID=3346601 RepID=UPI00366012C1